MESHQLDTSRKALQINLDALRYGTFAEIGAGQEVARWFFRVGGAAGTVAKTISAYDMAVSDAIYGPTDRYVSRRRLKAMLEYEYDLMIERLGGSRGGKTALFAFANTVATHKEKGNGWLGIRFQDQPGADASEIYIHVLMLDKERLRQQEALGIIGVNLVYGSIYLHQNPEALIRSLLDDLTWERVEVDMIRFAGPAFAGVDSRLMALQLVKQGLTEGAMFTAKGEAIQWAEVLYNRPVLVERGSFRPVTRATLAVLEGGLAEFLREPDLKGGEPVVVMEMTLRHLMTGDVIDTIDFLHRADTLQAMGRTVMVSNFRRFHRLAWYLGRYTDRPIGIALGATSLREILNPAFYNESEGGILGGLGQLFKNPGRLYVYPHYDPGTGELTTVDNFPVADNLRHLYSHLVQNRFIQSVHNFDRDVASIRRLEVLRQIQAGIPGWERWVPEQIAQVIKGNRLFGCTDPGAAE